jgi:hypothetical protein
VAIHLGVHKHPVVDGKCRDPLDEIRRLIVEEVNCTLDVKIFVISLHVSKTFLARHLPDDNGDGIIEVLDNEQLEHICHNLNLGFATKARVCKRCELRMKPKNHISCS